MKRGKVEVIDDYGLGRFIRLYMVVRSSISSTSISTLLFLASFYQDIFVLSFASIAAGSKMPRDTFWVLLPAVTWTTSRKTSALTFPLLAVDAMRFCFPATQSMTRLPFAAPM
jgi:hypothetical protein